MWITVLENRERKPYARARYRNYTKDSGQFTEAVQAIQAVAQYGQEGQVLRKYRRVQERIIEHGLAEARIGNRYGFKRSLVLSIAKRACQGVWIWQYRHNTLDAAMI